MARKKARDRDESSNRGETSMYTKQAEIWK